MGSSGNDSVRHEMMRDVFPVPLLPTTTTRMEASLPRPRSNRCSPAAAGELIAANGGGSDVALSEKYIVGYLSQVNTPPGLAILP